jgi:tRNA nucleotidyltransferase/poly(A) polymerase
MIDMFYDNKHSPEVQEWCYRMMNDPEYFEKWRFKDTIRDYNSIIEEFEKLYEQTSASDHFIRARSLGGIKGAQIELAKTQAEYDKFKEYKTRTAISK